MFEPSSVGWRLINMGRTRRLVVSVLLGVSLMAGVVMVGAPGAGAGGASFTMDRASYDPGDLAVARAGINWEHNPALGSPEDGPYWAYLVPIASYDTVTAWPTDPASLAGAVLVGEIVVQRGPIEEHPGFWVGPDGASVGFVVPDLPDGQYQLDHCNQPCTTPLADIIGGDLWIGPPPVEPVLPSEPALTTIPTTTVVPTTTVAPTTTTTSTTIAGLSTGPGAAGPVGGDAAGLVEDAALLLVPALLGLAVAGIFARRARYPH